MEDQRDPLTITRPSLNPYIAAARLLKRRILWDLHLESWRSRAKLKRLFNAHEGEKAVILCNGPSLLDVDFDLLDGVFTFGLNKINLLFDKVSFRPSCVVAVNRFVIEQNAEFYERTDIPLFLDSFANGLVPSTPQRCFLHSTSETGFARRCEWSINQGHTVTYVAMQLAFHMGFSEVALVGCDHNFATKGPANKTVIAGQKDENHFDPNYFAGGVKWQLPDLFESEVAYARARKVYEAFDRKIFNSTVGGNLDIFERRELSDFVSPSSQMAQG